MAKAEITFINVKEGSTITVGEEAKIVDNTRMVKFNLDEGVHTVFNTYNGLTRQFSIDVGKSVEDQVVDIINSQNLKTPEEVQQAIDDAVANMVPQSTYNEVVSQKNQCEEALINTQNNLMSCLDERNDLTNRLSSRWYSIETVQRSDASVKMLTNNNITPTKYASSVTDFNTKHELHSTQLFNLGHRYKLYDDNDNYLDEIDLNFRIYIVQNVYNVSMSKFSGDLSHVQIAKELNVLIISGGAGTTWNSNLDDSAIIDTGGDATIIKVDLSKCDGAQEWHIENTSGDQNIYFYCNRQAQHIDINFAEQD